MAYTVVNLDRMSGTEDSSQLLSVKYFVNDGSKDVETAIENGAIVKVGALLTGEREVRKATAPDGTEALKELALVANPEVIYDEYVHHGLEDYINGAGEVIRAYRFHQNDGFSVTAEAFSTSVSDADVGKYAVVVANSTKIGVSATATGTVIGKIDEVFDLGNLTYYYIQVAL